MYIIENLEVKQFKQSSSSSLLKLISISLFAKLDYILEHWTMSKTSIPYGLLTLSYMLWITSAVTASTSPLPPSKDPFYTAPDGYQNAAPGAVLRVRSAQGLAKVIDNCTTAYNILYRTTG